MKKLLILALAAVAAAITTSALAATPAVVWNSDFGTTSKVGTDGKTYTLDVQSNEVTTDGNLKITQGVAPKIALPSSFGQNITVVMKYSGYVAPEADLSILSIGQSEGCNDIGLYVVSNGTQLAGYYNKTLNFGKVTTAIPESGYIAMSYSLSTSDDNGVRGYVGTAPDGAVTYSSRAGTDGLRFTGAARYLTSVNLGGSAVSSSLAPFTGLVIEQVAIYTDRYTSSAALPHQDFVATTSGTVTWSTLPWAGIKGSTWSDSGLNELTLIVTDDTTLTLDSNVTATNLIIDVASGKTLTISGNYSITTADKTYFCGSCGTVSTAKMQVFGSTPKVYVPYPSVWTLTNSSNDTSDRGLDGSNITGNGSIELSSGTANVWRALPWNSGSMWTNSLGIVASEKGGVILSEGNRCWELGSLSGSYGFRSDYGNTAGSAQRQVRFTQSRDTTWSGTFINDRVDNVYVAGAADATAKTLTIASASTSADNPLTVEASGSVKLTGKWKGDLTVYGEFGGEGTVESATTVTIADGATIRADWGAATVNVKPTIGAGTDFTVIVASLPAKDTATQIFKGSSFEAASYEDVFALVTTADGTSKTYAAVSAQADGVYVTITDDALAAKFKSAPKYAYEMNGSFDPTGTSELTVSGDFSGDFTAGAVLEIGQDAGSHYGDSGFAYSSGYEYVTDWTIVTYAKTPAANQTIFSLGGKSGTDGLIGLRYAGSNEVKAFTTSGTDLAGVTLESDPTAGFHLYAIVYSASAGTIQMSVDGGEFSTAATFTPGSGAQWQIGGIHSGAIAGVAENATSGQMDSFRMYSYALTAADLQAMLASDFATVAKIGDVGYQTLGLAVAARTSADTVVEIVADCTETSEVALGSNLILTVADGSSFTVSAPISGAYSLTKQGDGTLTLAGANTYSAGTTVAAGVLTRGSAAAFGAANSAVTVQDGGSVDLGTSISGSTTYAYSIAGDGGEGHAYAMTGNAGIYPSTHGIGSMILTADATISDMTFGDNDNGADHDLAGFTLRTTGDIHTYNANYIGSGKVEVVSGTYTTHRWWNRGPNATLQVDAEATYNNSSDGTYRSSFTNVVNNGTISGNGVRIWGGNDVPGGTYSGTGTISNIVLATGSTLDLSAHSSPLETTTFSLDGTLTLALGSRSVVVGDVLVSASSSMTADFANVTVTSDPALETLKLGVAKVDNTFTVVDRSLPAWTTGSGAWSSTSYNGTEGEYDYSTAEVKFTGDGSANEAVVTIAEGDTIDVATIAFNNDVTPITISGGAITAERVTKTGAAAATVNSALTLEGSGISVGSGASLALGNVSGTTGSVVIDGTGASAGSLTLTVLESAVATVSGISGAGTVNLEGDGTVSLSAVSAATTINVNNGTLQVAASSADFCGTNVVASGATFDFYGHGDGFPVFILNGGSLVNSSTALGTGNRTLGNDGITLTADSYIGGTGNFGLIASNHAKFPLTLNGHVLRKTGTDTIYLSQAEDTTSGGTFAIEEGTVQIVRNVSLAGDTVVVSNGATLSVSGDYTLTADNLAGAGTVSAPTALSGMLDLTGGLSVSGSVNLGDGAVIRLPQNATLPFQVTSGTLTVENGATVTIQDYTGTAQSLWYIEGNTIAQRTVVASIGETTYYDLAEALDDLTENCTLVILADELSLTSEIATAITLDLNGHIVYSTGTSTPTLQRNVTVVDNAVTAGKLWFVNGLSGSEGDSFQLAKTANIDLVGVYGAASGTTLTLVEGYAVFAYPVTTVELVIDADSNITVSAATATALAGTAGVDATATALNATQANNLTVWQNTILGITSSSDSEAEDITVSITMVDGAPVITTTCGTVTGVTLSEPSKSVTVGNLVATVKLQSRADLSTGSWADVKSTDTHTGSAEFYRVSVSFSNTAE